MALYEKTAAELSELLAKKEVSAVELAKDFGGEDESPRFVNGVLGRIAKRLEDAAAASDSEEGGEARGV